MSPEPDLYLHQQSEYRGWNGNPLRHQHLSCPSTLRHKHRYLMAWLWGKWSAILFHLETLAGHNRPKIGNPTPLMDRIVWKEEVQHIVPCADLSGSIRAERFLTCNVRRGVGVVLSVGDVEV